jgi:hypothetical protein
MEPSQKDPKLEKALRDMFGFDRIKSIKSDVCVPPPIGCGQPVLHFRDAISETEFSISGLCQECQDKIFLADLED